MTKIKCWSLLNKIGGVVKDMEFEKVLIKNFRNYENVELDLTNKNVFFGLNDVGKTNLLYALRYVFDKDIRKQNFLDSDFHNKQYDKPIEIVVTLNISDIKDIDCQKLRAKLKGALQSKHDKVYIKLFAEYNKTEMLALPILSWGGDMDHLYEMKQRGYLYEIDYIFNVIYIDSYVDLYSLFKKNIGKLVKNEDEYDKDTLVKIQNAVDDLNNNIASLSGIKEFEKKLTPKYKEFHDEGISVSIKSEIAVKGLYSNVIPYIKQGDDDNLYPTAGEGRKKLLVYSIYNILSDETAEKKINLFLIEEPENHLHKSMQIALSHILFTDRKYTYMFVTTHSPFLLYEMNNVNLVRIYSERKINSVSVFYKVPDGYEKNRKMLNRCLSEAIFANKVLLVEGPSEHILFSKVLSVVKPLYEVEGTYILPVDGVGFEKYSSILNKLGIINVVKTDNDLRRINNSGMYSVLGFSRCNVCIGEERLPTERINDNSVLAKRSLYNKNKETLDEIRRDFGVFLSKVDLENDLDEFLHDRMRLLLNTNDPVNYLQSSKHYNMVELIEKLSDEDCNDIYNHYNFACLKEVTE
ncbi:AAA family ATPase [uncultured Ruminococcus sp.]|uniref:ATP-dependent nuclease n=1 Tax=uncultured Ruminococcus sp. TaxID=165186 RepID=UPI0025F95292|nr:AAA family ATPase [uncultured Ruminococcus sp.]